MNRYNLSNLLEEFTHNLTTEAIVSPITSKNYASDLRYFISWYLSHTVSDDLKSLSQRDIEQYVDHLSNESIPVQTINRRLSSLRRFFSYCIGQGYITVNPAKRVRNITQTANKSRQDSQNSTNDPLLSEIVALHMQGVSNKDIQDSVIAKLQKSIHSKIKILELLNNSIRLLQQDNRYENITRKTSLLTILESLISYYKGINENYDVDRPSSGIVDVKKQFYAGFLILLLLIGLLSYGLYKNLFKSSTPTLAYPSTLTKGARTLSFQGRLTDSLGNPIVAATNVVFKLHTASSGGSQLYTTGTCSVTPDQDGIFNSIIGQDCGSEIASSVFSENANVYLGVTVGSDAEMTPRQQIANVGYAINAENLQGFPPGTSASTIPYIDNQGDILLGTSTPSIVNTYASQTFVLGSANAVTLQAAGSGDVTLTATESGTIKFLTAGTQAGVVTNGQLWGMGTTGPDAKVDSLYTGGEQLRLTYADGSTYTGFTTNSGGDLTIDPSGDDLTIAGDAILADTFTLQVGGKTATAYNAFANDADGPEEGAIAADNDLYIGGDLEVDGSIYAGSLIASGVPWSGITAPTADLTIAMDADNTTFTWDPTANSAETAFVMNFDGEDSAADEDQVLLSLNQSSNGTDVTEAADALLTFTNSDANDPVENAIRFDAGAAGTDFTYGINFDAASIGTAELVLQNGETIANTVDGTIALTGDASISGTTGLTFTSTGGLVLAGGTISDGTDGVDIADNLEVSGDTTLTGDLAVNGDNITSDGTLTIDAATDINLDADGADIVLKDGGTTFATFTNSTTDLTLDIVGSQLILADTDVLNIGGVTGLAYNAISDSGTTSHSLASDDDLYVEGDVEVDGTLYVDGTLVSSGITCTDCLDFTSFEDTLDLDATTDINLGANNLTVDLDSTGIFDIRDGTTTFVSFDDDSTIDITFPAAGTLGIDAAATDNTTTAGVLNLDIDTATSGNIGSSIDYQVVDAAGNVTAYGEKIDVTVDTDAAQSHTVAGSYIGLTANDASSTTYGLQVVAEDAGGQVATSGILIENLQATDIDLTTGLLIRATTDGSLPTAIDVSDAEITTALSVGANTISGTTGLIDYTNFDLDASGNITLAGTTGVTFSSTGGIQLAGGVIADSSDGVDINDNLEINGGTVSLTNGTSDLIDWGSDGAGDPTTTSAGWKTKYYGNAYGHGVAGSTLWSVSDDTFKWYDNDTSTYNLKATMGMDTDTYWQIYNDALSEAIRFHTNGTSWFNGGSLVIGANATSAKFQVVGDESRFGTAGTITIATGDGDVYVQDALEVDGDLHLVAGADLIFGGTTTLAETTAANDSGAYIVGTFDEFDNSSSSNVQDVLDDLDAGLTTALANGGLWTDSTTTAYLTTTTDEVVIGGTSPLSSAKLSIDGDADQIQFIVQGNATQTANLATFENSSGTDLLTIDASGVLSVPYLIDISNSAYGIDPSGTSNFGGYSLKVTGGALLGFDSGNVGIGPAAQTADELLHVGEATDGDTIALLLENSQAAGAASTNETSQLRFGFGGNNDVARILAGKVNDYTSGANEDSFLSFYTDVNGTATEQLKIDEAGLATFTGDIAVNGDDITSDGTLTIDAATDINLDADGADIVLKDGGTTFATFTNSTTDLTLDIVGSQLILADTDVLNIGGVTGLAYNAISDSGTTSHSLASDDDLYVEGDVEVDGTLWADGAVTSAGTITGADFACTDCLDFAELEDTLDLDAALTLNQSTNAWTQNYAGTTGTGITYNVDSLTSGVALALASTSTAITTNSNLLTLDWSPGSLTTAAIDLFEISTTTNGNVTGSYLNFLDNSVSIFKVEQSGNVTTAGDIAVNGDDITADGALTVNSASYVRIGDSGTPGSASGDDDLYVEGDLEVDAATYLDGDLTIGNAGTDNVTVNSKTWTFANDTDFALSGGTNGLSFDTDTFSVDATNNRIGIGTTAPSEKLHVAGNVLVDAQSDATAHNFASGCNCSMNSAAGTFGSETSRDSVTDSVVYKGKLFVAVKETDLAGIYRWDGGTTWQLVTNTPGKVNSGDTANIDSFTMTVLNDKLVIGTQGTGTEAAIFYSTDADTGSTPTWTQVNTTKGSFGMSRTGISSVGDLAVLNNVLYMTNLGNNTMEFGRWNGSTGAAVFTQINATDGALAAETADIDNAVLAVYNNMVMIGAITSGTTARIGAYQPNTTGASTSIVIINATSGAFGNLVNSPDITQMEVYNGQLYAVIQRTNAASVVRWTGVSPVQGVSANVFFVTNTAGTLDSGDTANIDNIVLEQYNGKLYAASQTGSATNTGAVYEFDGHNTWTLVNTTRGTFDGTANVDNVTNMIAYDGTMYVGTDDLTNGVGAVYSWSKTASNSYGLKFKGGNNYGSISFVDKHNVNDATQQSGSFLLSHSIQLDSAGFDLAEDYPTYDTTLKSKEIVSLDPQKDTFIKRAQHNDNLLLGVISDQPGLRLAQSKDKTEGATWVPVALTGRVPVLVNGENGPIAIGDSITLSSTAGVGMKATAKTRIIGRAMSSFAPGSPSDLGEVTIFVESGTYDPETESIEPISATIEDSFLYEGSLESIATDEAHLQTFLDSSKLKLDGVVATTKKYIGTIIAGSIRAGNILAKNIVIQGKLVANSILAGSIQADAVKARYIVSNGIKADIIESDSVQTASLSASESITTKNITADTIDTQNIREIQERLQKVAQDHSTVASSAGQLQDEYADLATDVNGIQGQLAELTSAKLPDTTYYQPSSGTSIDTVTVSGLANIYDLYVNHTAAIGDLVIQDNQLASISDSLKISALNTIDLMDGNVIIARDGTITTKGQLVAERGIRTNDLKALNPGDNLSLTLEKGTDVLTGLEKTGQFEIKDSAGSQVASIGADGSAKFKDLSLDTAPQYTSIIAAADNYQTSGMSVPAIQTNAKSAGSAVVPANSNQIMLYNEGITDKSLIYITPTSNTYNKSVYVSSKNHCPTGQATTLPCNKYFVVSIDQPISSDIQFNWWIIE